MIIEDYGLFLEIRNDKIHIAHEFDFEKMLENPKNADPTVDYSWPLFEGPTSEIDLVHNKTTIATFYIAVFS